MAADLSPDTPFKQPLLVAQLAITKVIIPVNPGFDLLVKCIDGFNK